MKDMTIVQYQNSEAKNAVDLVVVDESIWATQKAMASMFSTDVSGISRHLDNIFKSDELSYDECVQRIKTVSATKPVSYFSLDAVISVGYRINSREATAFRQWATKILKRYIEDGYVLNEELLRSNPEKLNELAAKIRELRANEKNVYAAVRECFKLSAKDYDPKLPEVRKFFQLLQDKFHHAITGMTASKLIMDRADHNSPLMGMATIAGQVPTLKDAKIGKNYLDPSEIYRMHLLSEQFLLFAESIALREQELTAAELHEKLDALLEFNNLPVFSGYDDFQKDRAMQHAEVEYNNYIEILKLRYLGVDVDMDEFYSGGYEELKEQTVYINTKDIAEKIDFFTGSDLKKLN